MHRTPKAPAYTVPAHVTVTKCPPAVARGAVHSGQRNSGTALTRKALNSAAAAARLAAWRAQQQQG